MANEKVIQIWSDNQGDWFDYTIDEIGEYINFSTMPKLDNIEKIYWHNATPNAWLEIIYEAGASEIYNSIYGTYVLQ